MTTSKSENVVTMIADGTVNAVHAVMQYMSRLITVRTVVSEEHLSKVRVQVFIFFVGILGMLSVAHDAFANSLPGMYIPYEDRVRMIRHQRGQFLSPLGAFELKELLGKDVAQAQIVYQRGQNIIKIDVPPHEVAERATALIRIKQRDFAVLVRFKPDVDMSAVNRRMQVIGGRTIARWRVIGKATGVLGVAVGGMAVGIQWLTQDTQSANSRPGSTDVPASIPTSTQSKQIAVGGRQ